MQNTGVNLREGESIVATARLHPAALISPIIVFLAGVAVWVATPQDADLFQFTGLVLMVIGVWRTIYSLLVRRSTKVVLTNQRLVAETGPARRTKMDVIIGHVDRVSTKRGPQARLLGYGTLVVTARGAGNQGVAFYHVASVDKLAQQIRGQMLSQ